MSKIAQFNRFELELPDECVTACSHSGPCDNDVDYWEKKIQININPDLIRAELKEYGAWDNEDLKDDNQNKKRLIWIAAGNVRDEEKF
jgi:hypothetical protein